MDTQSANINSINSLLLLFVFDKMDVPLTETTILEMCCSRNTWINYMECKQAFAYLITKGFVTPVSNNKGPTNAAGQPTMDTTYALTVDGRMCLSHLFYNIPASTRAMIVDYVSENRMHYRRRQEYIRDYFLNNDGTYTVTLSINEPNRQVLEIKLTTETRAAAKEICNKWDEKASQVYSTLYELLEE